MGVHWMKETMSIRELAASLGIRLSTAYGLVWDGTVKATKENGEWVIDLESVEHYRLRRNLRRAASRGAMQHRAIDVTEGARAATA